MRYFKLICLLVLVAALGSCTSYKKVPYLQSDLSRSGNGLNVEVDYKQHDVVFSPGDLLSITVNVSREPQVASVFNLPDRSVATGYNSGSDTSQGAGRQGYRVNASGEIDFPVLGMIRVAGKNKEELENWLKEALKVYIKEEPVVTVGLLNFRISVLGEVVRPGQYVVSRDRINVIEALSLGGDMTIFGRRDNVMVMREQPDGIVSIYHLDISSAAALSSPCFYLQQNDVLYVEPNKAKAKSSGISNGTTIWFSVLSATMSLITMVVSFTR